MIQQQFQQMAQQILGAAFSMIKACPHNHETCMRTMKNAGEQLEQLRMTYEQLSGQKVEMPTFREMMQIA